MGNTHNGKRGQQPARKASAAAKPPAEATPVPPAAETAANKPSEASKTSPAAQLEKAQTTSEPVAPPAAEPEAPKPAAEPVAPPAAEPEAPKPAAEPVAAATKTEPVAEPKPRTSVSKRFSFAKRASVSKSNNKLPAKANKSRSKADYSMEVSWDELDEILKVKVIPPKNVALTSENQVWLVIADAQDKEILEGHWKVKKDSATFTNLSGGKGDPAELEWGPRRPDEEDVNKLIAIALINNSSSQLECLSEPFGWPNIKPREQVHPKPDDRFKAFWDRKLQAIQLDWNDLTVSLPSLYHIQLYQADERDKGNHVATEMVNRYEDVSNKRTIAPGTYFKDGDSYFARLVTYDSNNVQKGLATSKAFTIEGLEDMEKDRDVCTIKFENDGEVEKDAGFERFEVTVSWRFTEEVAGLSDSDTLTLWRADEPLDKDEWHPPHGLASGKSEGKVTISLAGIVTDPNQPYVCYYVRRGKGVKQVMGKSESKSFKDLPEQSAEALAMAKEASTRANMSSTIQHSVAKEEAKRVDYNPLLTIEPQPSIWDSLTAEREARRKKRRASAEERAAKRALALAEESKALLKKATDKPLDANELRQLVESEFSECPGFIYAGAGISMAAPASSPSWWLLMNELLKAVFQGAPEKHKEFHEKTISGDISRQPEEIMESFYFVLQDRLLTVFELLEAGEPNANHKAIALLAKAGKLKSVMTTNFDIFIERALKQEGVSYKSVVTHEEFEDFYNNGCKEFAVLKIHGSVDRPSTIVAVANHYKSGKGFSGYKEMVLSHYLRNHPTLFLGYSGWDFEHQNYQSFWAQEGENGGRNVYWLNLVNSQGPDLRKIVGSHIGRRLVIGEGYMPDWALDVVRAWDSTGAENVRKFHGSLNIDEIQKRLVTKRKEFLDNWVAKIPKPDLLTLLMIEGAVLNEKNQERMKRQKAANQDAGTDGGDDQQGMTEYLQKLGAEFAAGKITMEEYMEATQMVTVRMTFKYVNVPKAIKDDLIKLYMKDTKDYPLFDDSKTPQGSLYKGFYPSITMNVANGAPEGTSAAELRKLALDFLHNKVEANFKKGDAVGTALAKVYLYQSTYCRCDAEAQAKLDKVFLEFAENAAKEGWEDNKLTTEINSNLTMKVNNVAYGLLDANAIFQTQYEELLAIKDNATFKTSAMVVALGAIRGALYRVSDFQGSQEFRDKILMPLMSNANRDLPVSVFEAFKKAENEKRSDSQKKVLQRLEALKEEEILATFDFAEINLWVSVMKSFGARFQEESNREAKGYYPRSSLPCCVCEFLKPKLARAQRACKDSRVVQSVWSAVNIVGESLDDISMLRTATEGSLTLTGGKVLELTPVGIPESYANALQLNGDLASALEWYLKALDGIKTSVARDKTDAIVLQACLVQGVYDKEKALKLAFKYSPYFSNVQQFLVVVGPGRSLLVQQCVQWAKDLGFGSLDEAETKLFQRE